MACTLLTEAFEIGDPLALYFLSHLAEPRACSPTKGSPQLRLHALPVRP